MQVNTIRIALILLHFSIHRMVSRRKILSRSRDDLNLEQTPYKPEDEEDVWYQKDKLFKVSNAKKMS